MHFSTRLLSLITASLLFSGCSKEQVPTSPGLVEAGFIIVSTEAVSLDTELAGRTTASLSSEVLPQVAGIVKKRLFEEGAHVKAGQVLYEIESAGY